MLKLTASFLTDWKKKKQKQKMYAFKKKKQALGAEQQESKPD